MVSWFDWFLDMVVFGLVLFFIVLFFGFFVVENFSFSLSIVGLDLLDLSFHVNWGRVIFGFLLFLIVGCILLYSCYYMSIDLLFGYYVVVLMIFVFSMVGVVFRDNCLRIILS